MQTQCSDTATETVEAIWRYPIKSMMGEEIPAADVTARGILGDRAYALVDKASNRAAAVRSWAAHLLRFSAEFAEEPRLDRPAPPVRIACPDGSTLVTGQPDIDERLSSGTGRSLSLMSRAPEGLLVDFPAGTLAGKAAGITEVPLAGQAPAGSFFDAACIHLITSSTLDHLQKGYPQGLIDARRFRPNILVRSCDQPFAENGWVGRTLAIGSEVLLRISMPCPRCVAVSLPQGDLAREPALLRHVARNNMVDLGDIGTLPCVGVYADVVRPGRIHRDDAVQWLDQGPTA